MAIRTYLNIPHKVKENCKHQHDRFMDDYWIDKNKYFILEAMWHYPIISEDFFDMGEKNVLLDDFFEQQKSFEIGGHSFKLSEFTLLVKNAYLLAMDPPWQLSQKLKLKGFHPEAENLSRLLHWLKNHQNCSEFLEIERYQD